ncbi:MAG: universal stress protein [Methanotrichaceae archaeon]|nr:universal stress protein [Methanotrichaceae archaeon]
MFKRILIATDGSRHSEQAARIGIEIAKLSKGLANIVYIADLNLYIPVGNLVPPFGGVSPHAIDKTINDLRMALSEAGKKATNRIEDLAKESGVQCEKMIIEGHPANEILRLAEYGAMDLIVVGSIGKTGRRKVLIGSIAERVVRHSKVPVLIVHEE